MYDFLHPEIKAIIGNSNLYNFKDFIQETTDCNKKVWRYQHPRKEGEVNPKRELFWVTTKEQLKKFLNKRVRQYWWKFAKSEHISSKYQIPLAIVNAIMENKSDILVELLCNRRAKSSEFDNAFDELIDHLQTKTSAEEVAKNAKVEAVVSENECTEWYTFTGQIRYEIAEGWSYTVVIFKG